ncbi:MAG TPA: efflux RND transporter periplasmic adaptor subunit [Candidatus Limnocylindria bacterium]|nr:efflux RND transporter periplasmic adaptor subunit [Candidatus Limnocylindria bacterium]
MLFAPQLRFRFAAVALTALMGSAGLLFSGCDRPPAASAEGSRPVVSATKVTRGDLARELVFPAEFQPHFAVDLHARVAGFVRTLDVDIGDKVKAGQVLAELDIPLLKEDLARAHASLRRSEAESQRARIAYEDVHLAFTRLQAVAKSQPRLVAAQDLDAASSKDRTSAAAATAAQEQVQVAQSELDRLLAEEADTRLVAPFDGIVTELHANPGDLVQGGTSPSGQGKALVRLAQLDRLRLVFPVSVSHIGVIHTNDLLSIRLESGRLIEARIARFSHEVSMATRSMLVEADVTNDDLSLVPGMYAAATLKTERRNHVLMVPIEAVNRKQSPSVLTVGPDGVVAEQTVQTGLETPAETEILSGLKEGDLVLLGAAGRIKAGQKVEPKLKDATVVVGSL